MKSTKQFEEGIKEGLRLKANEANIEQHMFQKIKLGVFKEEERMSRMKNKFRIKNVKRVIIIGGLCLASMTAVAATQIASSVGWSRHYYAEIPEEKVMKKDVGFVPKYVDTLPGGFKVIETEIGAHKLLDQQGIAVAKIKTLGFVFNREGTVENQSLVLNTEKTAEEYFQIGEGYQEIEYSGIQLMYKVDQYKSVPEAYELTAQDKKDQEEGKLIISVGSDEVEYDEVQSIAWYEEGIGYILQGFNYGFTQDEMVEMAKTIIDQK